MPQSKVHTGQQISVTDGVPPHSGQPIRSGGARLADARGLLILIHGRGASAEDILTLAPHVADDGIAAVAPQASGGTWYPFSFMSPIKVNEPGLTSALEVIEGIIRHAEYLGFTSDRIALAGFSQGACLTLEYVARHPRTYAAVGGFSGGLIGPLGTTWSTTGTLNGTPVFLGCSDTDPHIPADRVRETAEMLTRMSGRVDIRLYEGMPHTIIPDELDAFRGMLADRFAKEPQ